ncbi:NAD(P)H-dependent oxidoreductase [Burkholderia sp. FERM BP-3421]|uniref:hypothetical protein n=1 Tax=Burkholderia sp. FERM BP-3421 TaxID=1494466 RepID=UPI0023626FAD|nr:hypothetical protein [Burkholderia sp. FERM BP-3421]WDD94123.1 NAD(P)H-dependent oxidoreductase [Burkholderia sp. FERM BP-3421]
MSVRQNRASARRAREMKKRERLGHVFVNPLRFSPGDITGIRILAICGSSRRDLLNRTLLGAAMPGAAEAGAAVTLKRLADCQLPTAAERRRS